jgi:hypothetical protein
VVAAAEAILRQPRRVMYQLRQPGSGRLIAAMLFVAVLCAGTSTSLSCGSPSRW